MPRDSRRLDRTFVSENPPSSQSLGTSGRNFSGDAGVQVPANTTLALVQRWAQRWGETAATRAEREKNENALKKT